MHTTRNRPRGKTIPATTAPAAPSNPVSGVKALITSSQLLNTPPSPNSARRADAKQISIDVAIARIRT